MGAMKDDGRQPQCRPQSVRLSGRATLTRAIAWFVQSAAAHFLSS
jgi:hypothetical protein